VFATRRCHGQAAAEVGRLAQWVEHPVQLPRVEAAVGVHERHHVRGRGEQTGVTGRSEPAAFLPDDVSAERACDVRGVVGRPVVDDDRAQTRRHPREDPQERGRLVEAGEHQVHRRVATSHASTLGGVHRRAGSARMTVR